MFHGFNMIHGDFCSEYTADVCNVIVPPRTETRDQLFAILALVNTYAPGSDFLLNQCEKFLQNRKHSTHGPPMFEDQMGRFSDLLVTYTNFENTTDYVRIAHPMIATKCVQLFRDHGLSMGEVTFLFLQNFCANTESPRLMQTTKSMLTLREMQGKNEGKERFSKLIRHVYEKEGKNKCRRLLMEASKIFQERTGFPQALARCYYLMVDKRWPIYEKDYINAEKWAKETIKRHPNNSFIIDTLGQVHKHHLFHYVGNGEKKCQSEVLRLGLLAINAFQEEEMAAEKEEAEESDNEATVNFSSIFNTRGKLGYLQVAEKLFESLQKINRDWRDVLTCSKRIQESLAVQFTRKSRNLTINLRAEVKKRFGFFEKYLTYSKPDSMKDDPIYIRKRANDCYAKYVEKPPRVLKMMHEDEDEMEEDVIVTMTDLQEFLRREDT
ncbi:sterile alpha motif domain-containing protein 9 [Clupea harengus]|uniref:Sterile alpha motif domain-containing protein 9 n=1 Tax=Clupea harengus TaxID=7950 RepID=A0A6P8GQZ0_CLUHA|nr:sterile alpha motif domain-containing protein 9 [Clupea harengus]XP_031441140.1 sterile alpha motif domain-containing protein 9 [Clupea harengus]